MPDRDAVPAAAEGADTERFRACAEATKHHTDEHGCLDDGCYQAGWLAGSRWQAARPAPAAAPRAGDADAEAAAYAKWRVAVLDTAAARAVPRGSGDEAMRRDDAYWRATLAQADAFRALHAAVERTANEEVGCANCGHAQRLHNPEDGCYAAVVAVVQGQGCLCTGYLARAAAPVVGVGDAERAIRSDIQFYHGIHAVYGPPQNCKHAICAYFWKQHRAAPPEHEHDWSPLGYRPDPPTDIDVCQPCGARRERPHTGLAERDCECGARRGEAHRAAAARGAARGEEATP